MYLYGGGPDGTPEVPGDERFRLHKDVKAITNEQIIEISEIVQSSHHINTRVMRCVAEPMVKVALKGAEANGCRTQPYFWSRWDPSYWTPVTFFIESGSISESLTDETTRSLSLTCHSEHWTTFESFQNEISPFHTLLRVERGVEVATSTSTDPPSPGEPVTIWIPLGIYRVHKVNFNRDHTADIEAYSLEQVLKDFLYEKIPAPLASARPWMGLWEETWLPGGLDNTDPNARDWSHVTYELSNSITPDAAAKVAGETFQSGFQVGTSFARWTGIRDMLEARHFNLYVNRVGKPIVVRIPEPQDAPADWVPQEIQNQLIMNEGGGANLGNIVSRTEDFNRDGLFNTIVAYGEIEVESNADGSAGSPSKAGTPVVTIVTDDNPASPTYVGGPFGQIGIELHVESLLAAGKLEVEGKAKLARSKILTTRTNLSLLPNPTIEVGDRIKVHYPDGSYRFFIIESADIPLTVDSELSVQAFTYDNSRTLACIGIPTDIQISWGPTDSAIRLNFLGVDGATGYEWTSDAALFWNPIVTTNLPNGRVEMEITGLRPLTDYSIRLRTVMDNDYECPPIQLIDDEFGIARIPGSLLVAEAGWPGRFQDPMATPANIVMANLYGAFHILPLAGSLAGVNSPWDQGAYILMADGMEATWTGDRFVQRIG